MRTYVVVVVFLVLLLATSIAFANVSAFINPPPFEPQRVIVWNFDALPWQTPVTAVGPPWSLGEWKCDYLDYSQTIQWYTEGRWPGHTGLIGYDNSNGLEPVSGMLKFHINNFPTANPYKFIWLELEMYQWGSVNSQGTITGPDGFQVSQSTSNWQELSEGGFRGNEKWIIMPNPIYEEFTWNFTVPAGGGIYIDRFAVATLCAPEPTSLLAMGLGVTALAGMVIRKRRS